MMTLASRITRSLVGLLLASFVLPSDARAAELDPWDRPEGSIVDKPARYYVWYAGKTWSLRSCAKMPRRCHGTLRVTDGKIKSCVPVGLKERKGGPETWIVNADRTMLTFSFVTSIKSDGLDIEIEGASAKVEFDLQIEKEHGPRLVFLGKHQQHPPGNPFTLPAVPVRVKKNPASK